MQGKLEIMGKALWLDINLDKTENRKQHSNIFSVTVTKVQAVKGDHVLI